ncbi:SO2930 family diheme c-type cytochrome [Reichenbachiella sp.]|uniref:SO2930 family diheme c-type cytochrome n=1 Tax=Reichenbachiella sp. TaxID=2184521 RepID=UPI003BB195FC
MRTFIYGLVVFAFISCQQSRQTKIEIPVPKGSDQTISEQVQYASLGFTKLSDYNFFNGKLSDLSPAENVLPYDLNTPLFSDYAKKKRFIYLPKGEKIGYREKEVLDFPIGTVLIKNFYYDTRQLNSSSNKILETRLLIRKTDGWIALPYIWNTEQSEAYLEITGGKVPIDLVEKDQLSYNIPDMNQCKSCHDKGGQMTPIGPSVRQLNHINPSDSSGVNQLIQMANLKWIELPKGELPKLAQWNEETSGSLDDRARAYLDINCAHCHNDEGPAKNSGLNLTIHESDPYRLGVNKKPVAAGRGSANLKYGIVPGYPNASILVHRMQTTEPGTMMPELGRTIPHNEGIALIKSWIEKM